MKKIYAVLTVIGLSLGCMLFLREGLKPPAAVKDFELCRSMIFQNEDNIKDVYIWVVVNIKDYDSEELFERIRNEHESMNGHTQRLTIRIYGSMDALNAGGCCLEEKVYTD